MPEGVEPLQEIAVSDGAGTPDSRYGRTSVVAR